MIVSRMIAVYIFQEEVKRLNKEINELQTKIRDSLEKRSQYEVS